MGPASDTSSTGVEVVGHQDYVFGEDEDGVCIGEASSLLLLYAVDRERLALKQRISI